MDDNDRWHAATGATPAVPDFGGRLRWWQRAVRVLLPLGILTLGFMVADHFYDTAPRARRKPPARAVALVDTVTVQPARAQVTIRALGRVTAARRITLHARVGGEIARRHERFVEGGILPQGTVALELDRRDHELAVVQQQGEVARARYDLEMELGHQEVARREWELLNGDGGDTFDDGALALRKPHLERAEAVLAATRAKLTQARLDLERTRIRIPFNAMLTAKQVDVGSQVSAQQALATLVGTDEFWVRVAVPVDRLEWFAIPRSSDDAGAPAAVAYGDNGDSRHHRDGRVVRLLGDVDGQGRMAQVLVAVPDPLNLAGDQDAPPLLMGSVVRVRIQGRELADVIRLPRRALREADAVWIARPDGRLDIRPVTVAWRDDAHVLIADGLRPGEQVVVSDLAAPVRGMEINAAATGDAAPSPGRKGTRHDS